MNYDMLFIVCYFVVLIGGLFYFARKFHSNLKKDYYNLICPKDGRNNISGNKDDPCVVCSLKSYPDQV